MSRLPRTDAEIQGIRIACSKLKAAVRTAYARRTDDSGPRGPVILAAVEALPDTKKAGDWKLFDALTEEERKPLEAFITQNEINAHADAIDKILDEKEIMADHDYLSAGDTHAASGDRAYRGCFHCGRSRKFHRK